MSWWPRCAAAPPTPVEAREAPDPELQQLMAKMAPTDHMAAAAAAATGREWLKPKEVQQQEEEEEVQSHLVAMSTPSAMPDEASPSAAAAAASAGKPPAEGGLTERQRAFLATEEVQIALQAGVQREEILAQLPSPTPSPAPVLTPAPTALAEQALAAAVTAHTPAAQREGDAAQQGAASVAAQRDVLNAVACLKAQALQLKRIGDVAGALEKMREARQLESQLQPEVISARVEDVFSTVTDVSARIERQVSQKYEQTVERVTDISDVEKQDHELLNNVAAIALDPLPSTPLTALRSNSAALKAEAVALKTNGDTNGAILRLREAKEADAMLKRREAEAEAAAGAVDEPQATAAEAAVREVAAEAAETAVAVVATENSEAAEVVEAVLAIEMASKEAAAAEAQRAAAAAAAAPAPAAPSASLGELRSKSTALKAEAVALKKSGDTNGAMAALRQAKVADREIQRRQANAATEAAAAEAAEAAAEGVQAAVDAKSGDAWQAGALTAAETPPPLPQPMPTVPASAAQDKGAAARRVSESSAADSDIAGRILELKAEAVRLSKQGQRDEAVLRLREAKLLEAGGGSAAPPQSAEASSSPGAPTAAEDDARATPGADLEANVRAAASVSCGGERARSNGSQSVDSDWTSRPVPATEFNADLTENEMGLHMQSAKVSSGDGGGQLYATFSWSLAGALPSAVRTEGARGRQPEWKVSPPLNFERGKRETRRFFERRKIAVAVSTRCLSNPSPCCPLLACWHDRRRCGSRRRSIPLPCQRHRLADPQPVSTSEWRLLTHTCCAPDSCIRCRLAWENSSALQTSCSARAI